MKKENVRGDATGQVIRPSFGRWLPKLVNTLRQSAGQSNTVTAESANVHNLFPDQHADLTADTTTQASRINDLRLRDDAAIAECHEWTERCESIECNLDRARQQVEQAQVRLGLAGEIVPEENAENLSALQESYQNFERTYTLQQQKLERAMQKIATLQRERASICAEVLALTADSRDDSAFRHAA